MSALVEYIEVYLVHVLIEHILVSICQILEIDGYVVAIIQIILDTAGGQDRNQQQHPYYVLPKFHCNHFIMFDPTGRIIF